MNSTKLFNKISNYLNQMCNSVDEIKGNYMKRYLLRMIKRDISTNTYSLDYETEFFIGCIWDYSVCCRYAFERGSFLFGKYCRDFLSAFDWRDSCFYIVCSDEWN